MKIKICDKQKLIAIPWSGIRIVDISELNDGIAIEAYCNGHSHIWRIYISNDETISTFYNGKRYAEYIMSVDDIRKHFRTPYLFCEWLSNELPLLAPTNSD